MPDPRETVTPQGLKTLQIITLAIASGVISFAVVVLLMFASGPGDAPPGSPSDDPVSMLNLLSGIHAVMVLSMFPLAFGLFGVLTKGEALVAGGMAAVTKAAVVRLALLESAAFLGLVICLLGALNGALHAHPVYWANALSTAFMLVATAFTFPTRDRVVALMEERMGIRR